MRQDDALAALVSERVAHEGRYALCHFGVHAGEGFTSPSGLWHHAFATHEVPQARCRCAANTEHVFDLDTGPGRGARTQALQRAILPHIMAKLGLQSGKRGDQSRTYPDNTNNRKHDHQTTPTFVA